MVMELFNDIFLTMSMGLVLSFLVAKLVSMAMSGDPGQGGSDAGTKNSIEAITVDEARSGERLIVQSSPSDRKVEMLVREAVENIAEFRPIQVERNVEIEHHRGEITIDSDVVELPMMSSEEKSGQDIASEVSRVVELPGESVEEVDVLNEKTQEFGLAVPEDPAKQRNKEPIAEISVESPTEKGIAPQSEEIMVFRSGEKERDEEREVPLEFEDDDWEGIERSELEKDFMAATEFVVRTDSDNNNVRLASIGSEVQMELYGLHKVATEGPCREPQPMALKLSARAKWNAWQKLGNMSPEVAMEQYIALLSDKVPGWIEDNSSGKSEQEIAGPEYFNSDALDKSKSLFHPQNLVTERELERQSDAPNCSLPIESDLDDNCGKLTMLVLGSLVDESHDTSRLLG